MQVARYLQLVTPKHVLLVVCLEAQFQGRSKNEKSRMECAVRYTLCLGVRGSCTQSSVGNQPYRFQRYVLIIIRVLARAPGYPIYERLGGRGEPNN